MAFNTQLTQALSMSDVIARGTSVISLSSQILEKSLYYIHNGLKTDTSRGINGFLFDVTKETIVNLTSEITDYPMEKNYMTQSHYAKRPVSISITGVCSDLRVHDPNDDWNLEKILDDATEMMEKISIISSNLQLGGAVKECQRVVAYMKTLDVLYRKIKDTVSRIRQIAKWFGASFGQDETTSQKKVYDTLYNYWQSGELLNVETPWKVYNNCVIEKLSFTQPEETVHQTEISVQFKQLTTIDDSAIMYRGVLDEKTQAQLVSEVRKTNDQPNVAESTLESGAEALAGSGSETMKESIAETDKEHPELGDKWRRKRQQALKKQKNKVDNASVRNK